MKLEGEYLFDAPVEAVWAALFDPVVLAAVMPGCEKLELVDGQYRGDLNIKMGPVQGKFTGVVDLKDVVQPTSYTMIIDGRGAPGFLKAAAGVTLAPQGAGTRLTYDVDAQVGGKIASIGQRLVDASAKAIARQSLEGLHENIKLRVAPGPAISAPTAAAALAEVPRPPPAVVRADPAAFTAAVAREVTATLVPEPLRSLLVFAVGVALGGLAVYLALK
jgi:carbon monoxide dehydrogenase subunit G